MQHIVAVPRRGASCYLIEMSKLDSEDTLLSPAGARVVTVGLSVVEQSQGCCPPQGRELLLMMAMLFAQRVIVAVPRRGASCYIEVHCRFPVYCVAVPRRGANCYEVEDMTKAQTRALLSPAGARVVTRNYFNRPATSPDVAVPAGARVVTRIISSERLCSGCCPPQGRELLPTTSSVRTAR